MPAHNPLSPAPSAGIQPGTGADCRYCLRAGGALAVVATTAAAAALFSPSARAQTQRRAPASLYEGVQRIDLLLRRPVTVHNLAGSRVPVKVHRLFAEDLYWYEVVLPRLVKQPLPKAPEAQRTFWQKHHNTLLSQLEAYLSANTERVQRELEPYRDEATRAMALHRRFPNVTLNSDALFVFNDQVPVAWTADLHQALQLFAQRR